MYNRRLSELFKTEIKREEVKYMFYQINKKTKFFILLFLINNLPVISLKYH